MRKTIVAIIAAMTPMALFADTFDQLWKQYSQAQRKDLPRRQIEVLDKIAVRAEAEKSYGNLLRAEVERMTVTARVSADSLKPAVSRMEERAAAAETTDKVLAAVYNCVLGDVYATVKGGDFEGSEDKSREYYGKSLASPGLLARTSALGYAPFVTKGTDSGIFNNDLLSVIGYKAGAYELLNKYYDKAGNRRAALLTALEMVEDDFKKAQRYTYSRPAATDSYVQRLDSLIAVYGDLAECGEAAMEKYLYLNGSDNFTDGQKAEMLTSSMKRWAAWRNVSQFENEYKSLTQPLFEVSLSGNILPMRTDSVEVTARNLKNLKIVVTRLKMEGNNSLNPNDAGDWKKIKPLLLPNTAVEVNVPLGMKHEYDTETFRVALPKLQSGLFLVEISSDNRSVEVLRKIVAVSDVFVGRIYLPDGRARFAVVSATSGQPLAGAKIELWKNRSETKAETYTADGAGLVEVKCPAGNYDIVRAYTDGDNYMQNLSAYGIFTDYGNDRKTSHTSLFTDRAIYRPGQTVHVSAVAYGVDGLHSASVASGKELTFTLLDANRKVVAEKRQTTDGYGTASVDFNLPKGNALNGRFSVRCTGVTTAYRYFRVEEYKRPTYEVALDDVTAEYHNGDTVAVTGKATTYAGFPVQNARVAYTVTRRASRLLWRYYDADNETEMMTADTVTTDADGWFTLRVPVVMPEGYKEANGNEASPCGCVMPRFYTFTASAQVTDNAGESHSAETVLRLGDRPTALTADIADRVLRDSVATVSFRRYNASGKEIEGSVTYWFDNGATKYTAKANEKVAIDWSKLPEFLSGRHTLTAVCAADTVRGSFVLFSLADTKPADSTPDWTYISSTVFPRDGKPVYLQIGSSCENTHVMYSVIAGKKEIESGVFDLSDAVKTILYMYKEEYGEGLLLNFMWVKDGVAYTHKYVVARPMEDKTLNLKWITFRDKLTPGQKETWTLNISRPDINDVINKNTVKNNGGAHLLALMYDKSLDQIEKYSSSFGLRLWQNQPSTKWNVRHSYRISLSASQPLNLTSKKAYCFNKFNYDLNDLFFAAFADGRFMNHYVATSLNADCAVVGYGNPRMAKKEAAANDGERAERMSVVENKATTGDDSAVTGNTGGAEDDSAKKQGNASNPALQIRENLQETAFFYPDLHTDSKGNVNISFTLPESVTTWTFRGFAHDKSMNTGEIQGEATASKQVMVTPNVPRFVRVGDKATIATRVMNATAGEIATSVVMRLIDPETDKEVYSASRKVTLAANSTANVVFDFSPVDGNTLLVCRISAEGKGYSDGEQHYLPVLPNTEWVVNTVPFTLQGKGGKTVSLEKMFPEGATDKKLTVEYTANPAWLMVQALPYMSETNEKNAMSLVAAYYANSLGKYIMDKTPAIRRVVNLWKEESAGKENSLASALQKNQELKTLVLEETPWVMDADREAEQKEALATFFDESAISQRTASQLEALKKLQNSDGSWSWWQGMDGSPAMTAQVLQTLARLKVMTGDDNETAAMTERGMSYLGGVVVKEYKRMREMEKGGQPVSVCDPHAIQYLYINALLGRQLPAEEKQVKDYLMEYLRKDCRRDIYSKALMAVVLQRDGKSQEAREYVESIRQYSVATPETGRYFDTYRAGYSWFDYRIPTQTAAIEAIRAVEPADGTTLSEMRLWLLQSKRTQAWDTPINSVNAVYAFLDGNETVLSAENAGGVKMSIDAKSLAMPKATAGIGYSKTAVDIDRQKELAVTKTSGGISWGAAYAQFSQPLGEVAGSESGIKVERRILVTDAAGKDKAADGAAYSLAVGDRITVRITVTADRDYDFVQLVDKHAACMEPVDQTSGYAWGYYQVPKDNAACYYFDRLSKGRHVVETQYYVDRSGVYTMGTCSVQCAYAPEFSGRTGAATLTVGGDGNK